MTKKLKWRLKNLPSGAEVAKLAEQKVITKEEARELLFSDTKQEEESTLVQSLKKQIDFLEGLVKELSRNNGNTVYVDRYVRNWPSVTWMYTGAVSGGTGTSMDSTKYVATLTTN